MKRIAKHLDAHTRLNHATRSMFSTWFRHLIANAPSAGSEPDNSDTKFSDDLLLRGNLVHQQHHRHFAFGVDNSDTLIFDAGCYEAVRKHLTLPIALIAVAVLLYSTRCTSTLAAGCFSLWNYVSIRSRAVPHHKK